MDAEVKHRKFKVVFCVTEPATGEVVAGNLPVDGDDMFQLTVEFPPKGIELVSEESRLAWLADNCSAIGSIAGKKIASILQSLVLPD